MAGRWETLPEAKRSLREGAVRMARAYMRRGVTVGSFELATDDQARQRMRELKDWSDDNLSASVPVELRDGRVVLATRAQFITAAKAVWAHVSAVLTALSTHIEAINALASLAAAEAYNLETGWPA
jgi:hypothetical protein